MVIQICYTAADNTHKFTWWKGETKWWNGVKIKTFISLWWNGVMNMVKWCREYTQFHMVIWWNTLAEISSSQNGKMVKRLYSRSSALYFARPFNNGYQARFRLHQLLHPPSRFWVFPCWSYNRPISRSNALQFRIPLLLSIEKFLLYLPSATANTMGVCRPF